MKTLTLNQNGGDCLLLSNKSDEIKSTNIQEIFNINNANSSNELGNNEW